VAITETNKPVALLKELFLYEEPEGSELNWEQVYQNAELFQPQEKPTLYFGYRDSPLWLKVKLINKTDTQRWAFSIDNVAIDYIDIFLVDIRGRLVDSAMLGDMRPFSMRKLQTLSQSASFELPQNQHFTLLIKAYGKSTLFLPVTLSTEQQLEQQESISKIFISFLIGIMFALGLNNLYIFYTTGDRSYAYYCFYLTSLIGFSLYTSGLGYKYIWRDAVAFQNIIIFVWLGILFHGALSFSQHFLRTQTQLPRMHVFINYVKFLGYLSIPVSLVISKSTAVSVLTAVNAVFIFIVIYCGVQSARQRYTSAYFYLASWLFLISGLMIYNLTVKGIIEPNFYTTKAVSIGSAIEAILLSSALAFRMRSLISERDIANRQARQALIESNQKMAESLEAAEKYNKAKDEFLSVVNHELRTPMNGIVGNLQLMEMKKLDNELDKYVKGAHGSADDMMKIVDNMLFVAEIGSQRIKVDASEVDFKASINKILADYSAKANDKNLKFVGNISASIPDTISLDWDIYQRMFNCILENAIKFTDKGSIFVTAGITKADHQQWLVCTVADSGMGMSKKQLERLFTPFSQANTSYTRSSDGLGLGLTVAKQIADLLKATIEIKSNAEKGTQVTISLLID
jgi:two-component system, sensor histidine kinase LadS